MHLRTSLVVAVLSLAAPAFAQDNPECLGSHCGTPQEQGGGGGGSCVAGVCVGGGCSVWVAYTDDGKTLAYTDDADGDGKSDVADNCPFATNRDQLDDDGDGVGNSCDNCALSSNFAQLDSDGDASGDACDPDLDGDGLENLADNCPSIPNPAQTRTNPLSGFGDVCNADDDGDGVTDSLDNCPLLANANQVMPTGAVCSTDTDGDSVFDQFDNCVGALNGNQHDADLDGRGDVCDLDLDDDGILNEADNCAGAKNRGQWDEDADGLGDACDARYCVVVDPSNKEDCLDPNGPFRVHGGGQVTLKAGEKFRLPLFANRNGAAIEYTWTVTKRPSTSTARIEKPVGVVTQSRRWMYAYAEGSAPTFTADVDGEYALQLQAHLVFSDRVYPANRDSTSSLRMNAMGEGGPVSCSAVPLDGALFAAGLVLVAARRSRRR